MKSKGGSFSCSYDWFEKAHRLATEYGWEGVMCESDSGIGCIPDWSAAGVADALDRALDDVSGRGHDPTLPEQLWEKDGELQAEYDKRISCVGLRHDSVILTDLRLDMLCVRYPEARLNFFAEQDAQAALRELAQFCRTGFIEYS